MSAEIELKLVSSKRGYDDLDVSGIPGIFRVCIPHGISAGEYFNVYLTGCRKIGALWLGSVEKSLTEFSKTVAPLELEV